MKLRKVRSKFRGFQSACWATADDRFCVYKPYREASKHCWWLDVYDLSPSRAEDAHLLQLAGLYDAAFPTRRAALEQLALALGT